MQATVPPDLTHADGARRARKRPVTVTVSFALSPGTLDTREGPVRYAAGDALLEGAAGDRWPVPRARFDLAYEPHGETVRGVGGAYRSRARAVLALCMPHPFRVALSGGRGSLDGAAGDWLVQYAPGDQAVVARAIFEATYELLG